LTNIWQLVLCHNNISDISILKNLNAGCELYIEGNPIIDRSPVAHIFLVDYPGMV